MINGRMRLFDKGTGDLRCTVKNDTETLYSVVITKAQDNVKILDASGTLVVQYAGNNSIPAMLQGAKNYLMGTLSTTFSCNNVARDANGVVLT